MTKQDQLLRMQLKSGMSHSSGYRATCANYQGCHLKSARLLDNSSRNVFTPRCHEMDNHHMCSARTSVSVGEEALFSRRDEIEPILTGCGSQAGATYFTKYLELKVAKIQDQHQKIQSENAQLNNQLSRANARNRQLEEKMASLEEALLREKCQRDSTISAHQDLPTATIHQEVNTSTTALLKEVSTSPSESTVGSRSECAVQTPPTDVTLPLDLVSISKSELASLENDMKTLREAVKAKEQMWEQAMERERNYREHWARLSRELITVRQQFDSRDTELKSLERKLTDQTEELRTVQKELSFTKKNLQKNQRDSAGSNHGLTSRDSAESQHSSPRQSPKFRSNKMSPTKDTRGATTRMHSIRDHRHSVSPRFD